MNKFLYVLEIVVFSFCCQPAFWQVNTEYKFPVDDLASISTQGIQLNDIQHSRRVLMKYKIQDIKTKVLYDDSKQIQKWEQNSIIITGGILNFELQFKAQSKNIINGTKKYLGNVTAKMNSLIVNYTKKATLKNNTVYFIIQQLSIQNTSTIIPQKYDPIPEDINQFNLLIKNNLTQQLLQYYESKLQSELIQVVNKNNFPFTFNTSSYVYSFGKTDVNINTSVTNFTISQKGYVIGYNGTVGNKKTGCCKFIPKKDQQAFYMSFFTASDLYDVFYYGYSEWQTMILNRSNTDSHLFSFNMIDLEQILPTAVQQFPNYLDKVSVQSSLNNSISRVLGYEDFYATFITNLKWQCCIYRVIEHINLLNFSLFIKYRVPMRQIDNTIETTIQNSELQTVTLFPFEKYPLKNQKLVQIYLANIINKIKGSTIGSGFLQPFRNNTSIDILKGQNYVVLKFSQKDNKFQ